MALPRPSFPTWNPGEVIAHRCGAIRKRWGSTQPPRTSLFVLLLPEGWPDLVQALLPSFWGRKRRRTTLMSQVTVSTESTSLPPSWDKTACRIPALLCSQVLQRAGRAACELSFELGPPTPPPLRGAHTALETPVRADRGGSGWWRCAEERKRESDAGQHGASLFIASCERRAYVSCEFP